MHNNLAEIGARATAGGTCCAQGRLGNEQTARWAGAGRTGATVTFVEAVLLMLLPPFVF